MGPFCLQLFSPFFHDLFLFLSLVLLQALLYRGQPLHQEVELPAIVEASAPTAVFESSACGAGPNDAVRWTAALPAAWAQLHGPDRGEALHELPEVEVLGSPLLQLVLPGLLLVEPRQLDDGPVPAGAAPASYAAKTNLVPDVVEGSTTHYAITQATEQIEYL